MTGRILIRPLVVALLVSAALEAQNLSNFWLVPDGDINSPQTSSLVGSLPIGGVMTPVSADFAEPLRDNKGAFFLIDFLPPPTPNTWNVVEFEMAAIDPSTRLGITMRPQPGSPPGTLQSSQPPVVRFVDGSWLTLTLNTEIAVTPGTPGAATTTYPGTLQVSGIVIPSHYHSIVRLDGVLTCSAFTLSCHVNMKQDFYPPSTVWETVVKPSTSWIGTASNTLTGGLGLQRSNANPNLYRVVDMGIAAPATGASFAVDPANPSFLLFAPVTHVITGILHLLVTFGPGSPPIPLDSAVLISSTFTGSATDPRTVTLEAGAGNSTPTVHIELFRPQIVLAQGEFIAGTTPSLLLRARPGDDYIVGLCLTTAPGINSPVGDIPIWPDIATTMWVNAVPLALGTAGPTGEVVIQTPVIPSVPGAALFFGGATARPGMPAYSQPLIRSITNSHRGIIH